MCSVSSFCCKFKYLTRTLSKTARAHTGASKLKIMQVNNFTQVQKQLYLATSKFAASVLSFVCLIFLIYFSSLTSANQRQASSGLQQSQQQANKFNYRNQSATTTISSQLSNQPAAANGARPLDRPSLSLVSNFSNPAEIPDGAADWFMMGGGDLMIDEAKSVASFASGDARPFANNQTIKSTRRMAEMKHHRKQPASASSKGLANNRTIFDDEQASDASDSNEIFDDAEESAPMAGTQKEPECAAHGRYYCTFKEDYPLKLVTEVTKYYKWPLEKLFRDLHAQIMPKLAQDSTGNLVCDSITRVVRPGWARNTNDRWLVVINTDNYHQYVTEVVCQYGTNSRCNFIPPCYYSSCQQRYNTQKLLVIDPTNPYRGPFLSEFLFPSCCVCYIPSSSDTFQDKYRSSPATIYQRTMQQEAASNLHPPQFKPQQQMSLLEEAFGSGTSILGVGGVGVGGNQMEPISSASRASASSATAQSHHANQANQLVSSSSSSGGASSQLPGNKAQPAGPGEIRRAGEQYRRKLEQQQQQQQFEGESRRARQHDDLTGESFPNNELTSFPRLGLSDSLLDQKSVSKE